MQALGDLKGRPDPRVPTDPVTPPYALPPLSTAASVLAWLGAEARDHLWPWGRLPAGKSMAWRAASVALATAATLAWALAATGRLSSGAVIAWWFGWSVYEVLIRLAAKPHVKDGPWWGRRYRRATVMDMLSYVGFKNLLIGAALFLVLKALGWLPE